MNAQLTIRLPEDLDQALTTAAQQMQRKRSEVVRLALQSYLGAHSRLPGKPADRARHLIGSLDSGIPDLAERHREYILESLRRGE